MNKTLVLTFNTAENKTYRVTIKNPKENIERATINTVAEKLITTKAFNNAKRTLVDLKKSAYVTREETIVE